MGKGVGNVKGTYKILKRRVGLAQPDKRRSNGPPQLKQIAAVSKNCSHSTAHGHYCSVVSGYRRRVQLYTQVELPPEPLPLLTQMRNQALKLVLLHGCVQIHPTLARSRFSCPLYRRLLVLSAEFHSRWVMEGPNRIVRPMWIRNDRGIFQLRYVWRKCEQKFVQAQFAT